MGRWRPPRGTAIHVAVARVDPAAYGGWDGELQAPDRDAETMRALAAGAGFDPPAVLLSDRDATASAVLAALRAASQRCAAGDLLLLTFSGHGGQLPDLEGQEPDARNETWVLHDRMLVDNELRAAFSRFASGVRILVISDCCHSGSDVELRPPGTWRLIPSGARDASLARNGEVYALAQNETGDAMPDAGVLLLAACQDDELAYEDEDGGLLTSSIATVWANGSFSGTYATFRDDVAAQIAKRVESQGAGAMQRPNLLGIGGGDLQAFADQRPFTIPPPAAPSSTATTFGTSTAGVSGVTVEGGGTPRAVTVTVRLDLGG